MDLARMPSSWLAFEMCVMDIVLLKPDTCLGSWREMRDGRTRVRRSIASATGCSWCLTCLLTHKAPNRDALLRITCGAKHTQTRQAYSQRDASDATCLATTTTSLLSHRLCDDFHNFYTTRLTQPLVHHVWTRKGWQGKHKLSDVHVYTSSCASLLQGLGKGGAKRHRKILRDNIQGITKPVRDAFCVLLLSCVLNVLLGTRP